MAGPSPGWYPDPWRVAAWRWWDGDQWTGYLSPGAAASFPLVSPVELQNARAKEERTWRWARLALVAVLIVLVGQWFAAIEMGQSFRHIWDQIQASNRDGQVVQITGVSPANGLYLDLFYLAAAVVAIVVLIWQHSAATVARALGYPSRTSPAFGVGSWFIPVVNLWFPYWALSDTLPPNHPMRPRCLWAWVAYIAAVATGTATCPIALLSTGAAVVVMVISGIFGLVAIWLGTQLVSAVTEDHRQRLGFH